MNFILLFRLLFFKFLLINHLVNCGIGIDKPHVGGQENQKTQFLKQGSNKRKNLPEEVTNPKKIIPKIKTIIHFPKIILDDPKNFKSVVQKYTSKDADYSSDELIHLGNKMKNYSNQSNHETQNKLLNQGPSSSVTSVHYEDNFTQSEKNDAKIDGIAEDRINKMVEELQNMIKEFNDEEILELLNLYEQTKNKNENIKHPQNVILLKAWYLAEYAIKNALKNVDEYLAVYDEIYLNLMIKYLYKEISEKLKIPEEFLEHEIQIINTENTVNNRVLSALIRVNAAKVLLMYYRLKNIFGVFNFINVKNKHYFVNGGKIFTQKDPKTFTPLYFENHIFNMMKYFESKKENKGKQIQKVTCSASDDFELSDSN